MQKSASIQKRTSPLKFDQFRNPKSDFTASDLSTKAATLNALIQARDTAVTGDEGELFPQPLISLLGVCILGKRP